MTANEQLRSRWSAWMGGSLLAAVAAHATILGLFPGWEVPLARSRNPTVEFVQLIPLPPDDELPVSDVERMTIPPSAVPLHPEEKTLLDDEAESQPFDQFLPVIAASPSVPLVRELLALDRIPGNRRGLKPMVPPIAWPEIDNPASMQLYLRSRYNALLASDGATGTVTIALWVDERGSVERAQVSESSGIPVLDEIALALFREVASFRPARDGVRPLAVQFTVDVPFAVAW